MVSLPGSLAHEPDEYGAQDSHGDKELAQLGTRDKPRIEDDQAEAVRHPPCFVEGQSGLELRNRDWNEGRTQRDSECEQPVCPEQAAQARARRAVGKQSEASEHVRFSRISARDEPPNVALPPPAGVERRRSSTRAIRWATPRLDLLNSRASTRDSTPCTSDGMIARPKAWQTSKQNRSANGVHPRAWSCSVPKPDCECVRREACVCVCGGGWGGWGVGVGVGRGGGGGQQRS